MSITQKQIAEHLGVSQQAVSFALSGGGTVSDRMRAEVLQAASELGYRRNEIARAMATGKSQMIGFLRHAGHRHEQAGYMLEGILDEADARDLSVKVFRYHDSEIDRRTLERCAELRLAGVIVLHAGPQLQDRLHDELERYHIPLVLLDNAFPQPRAMRVAGDDAQGIALSVRHLVELGHKRIGFLGGNSSRHASAKAREDGFFLAMRACKLSSRQPIAYADFSDEAATEAAARKLLQTSPRPSAIVCVSDLMAMLVLRESRRAGLKVPDELSITGFDDLTMSAVADPSLTTVGQPWEEMGRVAVRKLVGKAGKASEILLPSKLVVRGSTASPMKS